MRTSVLLLGVVAALLAGTATAQPSSGAEPARPACGSVASTTRGRRFLQEGGGCGGAGNTCCCQPVQGPPRYYGCCRDPALWCHFFDFTPPGIPGACPQPSLCLPLPSACGQEGQPCCPPPSDLGGSYTCKLSSLACRGAGAAQYQTYDWFIKLQGGKGNATLPIESYGTCIKSPADGSTP